MNSLPIVSDLLLLTLSQIYPALANAGIRLSPLKRISGGFFIGAAAMVWAAVLQYYIYKVRWFFFFLWAAMYAIHISQSTPCGNRISSCIDPVTKLRIVSPLNVWIQSGS